MKFQCDGTGSLILKICRLAAFASAVSCTIFVFKLELITLKVHTTILKTTNATTQQNSYTFRSEQFFADEGDRGGSIHEFESVLTSSYYGIESAGKQVHMDESERSAIAITKKNADLSDGTHIDDANPDVTARPETTRFVLFLCDTSFFKGAVALLASLAESSSAISLPPLVMVMKNVPIQPFEQEILEALGAQVKVVDQPQELADAIEVRSSIVKQRWRGVFSKMHVFRRDIVDCDIVFYIDVDAVVRGNLIECMDDVLQLFRSKPELDILAAGRREYFNNGVMLARPRDSTFSYLVEMLRNGTCVGNCTDSDYTTKMRRRIHTDQDIFIEYTQRFPNRFEPITEDFHLNLRPMHYPFDIHGTCSVIHYAGGPKPWEAWFALPKISILVDGSSLPMLPEYFPESLKALKQQRKKRGEPWTPPDWSLEVWRDYWNRAVTRLHGYLEIESAATASYDEIETTGKHKHTSHGGSMATAITKKSVLDAATMRLDDTKPDVTARAETTRFVLFLFDLSFFKGAVALLASLAESSSATSLPPLVMIMEDVPIQPFEQEILEALGAQVKVVDQPQELADAMKLRSSQVKERWRGVFSKVNVFRRDVVDCDIVFYIDVDAVVRGNLIDCMGDILQLFRSKPELDILAAGRREYFNNGVMLARPSDSTFSYLVEMLRNGTCVGNCTNNDYTTMMRRRIHTDQDIFIEYTQRFPDRFEPINKDSHLNLRPMHHRHDFHANCSVIHYAGGPKPWEAWFALPNISILVDGASLPMLPKYFPESLKALKKRRKKRGEPWTPPDWSLEVWRDYWNQAVTRLQAYPEIESAATASYDAIETAGKPILTHQSGSTATAITKERALDDATMRLDDTMPDVTARAETTRFVLFLCDLSFFNGAVALLASLAESSSLASLPPLVMIMEDVPIQPFEQEILEALGAQVKVVDQPQELADAMKLRTKVKQRWRGVFSKMHLFRRDIVDCDIVFYIDVDAVVRGNLIDCMGDILQLFRSKPELDILAAGRREYFNNGVMLARPRDSTFSYLVEMLRNGTCVGDCTDSNYTTKMRRRINTDQDIFIEYTKRFPNRFEPINKDPHLNLRPMHHRHDIHANCSVIHYAGGPKPWEAWFALPNNSIPVDGSSLPMLPEYFPESFEALKKRRKKLGQPWTPPDWSLKIWRDYWNRAVTRLQSQSEIFSPPLDVLFEKLQDLGSDLPPLSLEA